MTPPKARDSNDADVIQTAPAPPPCQTCGVGDQPGLSIKMGKPEGPGFGKARLTALRNVNHLQRPLPQASSGLQHHPVRVPDVAIVTQVAIAVFIKQRRVVEVGVAGHSQGQNSALGSKPTTAGSRLVGQT